MRIVRGGVLLLSVLLGGWMAFDGARALTVGDYVTPVAGPHAGELGPWARVAQAAGIQPRATGMKVTFVAFGLAWLLAAAVYLRREQPGGIALTVLAVGTLWYLPVGTLLALLILACLAIVRARSNVALQLTSAGHQCEPLESSSCGMPPPGRRE